MDRINSRFIRGYYALISGRSKHDNRCIYNEQRLERVDLRSDYNEAVRDALRIATGYSRKELNVWQSKQE